MDRYTAFTVAAQHSGNPHKAIAKLNALGFEVIATDASFRRDGPTLRDVRMACNAHSPHSQYSVGQITHWLNVNGKEHPQKAIYNALAYLVRRGEITHRSRGYYGCQAGGQPE